MFFNCNKMEITIEHIIESFHDCSFADLGGALPYIRKLFANHLPDQTTPPDEIKKNHY